MCISKLIILTIRKLFEKQNLVDKVQMQYSSQSPSNRKIVKQIIPKTLKLLNESEKTLSIYF